MSILHWNNYQSLPHYLRDEESPYSLPIIIRIEKDLDLIPSHEDALLATAKGIISFFDDSRTVEGEWAQVTNTWLNGRIRKVARRARAAAWDKALALGGIYSTYGKAEVVILPPHPVDAPPAEVKKLQVSGLDLPRLGSHVSSEEGLFLSVNPEIPMSTGKTLAQIGHAAQLAIFNSNAEELSTWQEKGLPVSLTSWDAFSSWTAEIQDAGFTEVPAGSLTSKSKLI